MGSQRAGICLYHDTTVARMVKEKEDSLSSELHRDTHVRVSEGNEGMERRN